jgi:hypothetical protein
MDNDALDPRDLLKLQSKTHVEGNTLLQALNVALRLKYEPNNPYGEITLDRTQGYGNGARDYAFEKLREKGWICEEKSIPNGDQREQFNVLRWVFKIDKKELE